MSLPTELPINSIIPDLRDTLRNKQSVVLSSPPGSGKTTVVPLALLEEDWLDKQSIMILEPRRLAARMAARRMASILEEPVGRTVGYRVRFDSKVSSATRIEVVTEGILTRRLQQDPELTGVGLVVFDEFHERSLHADLALSLCLDVIEGLRENLKILVMSATLDVERIAGLLGDAGIIQGKGREYPVDVRYFADKGRMSGHGPRPENLYFFSGCINRVKSAIIDAAHREQGDMLVFLPGAGEIRHAEKQIADWAADQGILVYPLHGNLPKKNQDKAVLPDAKGRRRVVLATSIAETSLTIEGVQVVIDSGWSRVQRFDPNSGLSRLTTIRVSMASAEQRRGRAGRLGPGTCYRLWNEKINRELKPYSRPEILDADLAWFVLELANWGVTDPGKLKWLDQPPPGHVAQAVELLTLLGALDKRGRITPQGKRMATLPVHPRLASMLVAAEEYGGLRKASDIAALLTERDIFRSGQGTAQTDIDARLQVLDEYREAGRKPFSRRDIDEVSCSVVGRASRQFRSMLKRSSTSSKKFSAGALVAWAYPDRIAKLRPSSYDRYLLASGRGACLPDGDHLVNSPYLVAAELDASRTEGRIFLAASITEQELYAVFADDIQHVEYVVWDSRKEEVVMSLEVRLQHLVLSSRQIEQLDQEEVLKAMLEGISQMGLDALPWTREARTLQARILLLREHMPDIPWPDCSDQNFSDNLDEWLGPYLPGITSRRALSNLDIAALLKNKLDWNLQQQLEELAPSHIQVPSGSRKKVQYEVGSPPVLAVRLQEMFGLHDTPSICRGRVRVMLHLLSPAQRPIQITQDLRGFWANTYAEVKKELKGRYPKHHWPDDPLLAIPTGRAKPKRSK